MKKLLLFLFFSAALVSAQNQRFIYNYTFVKDTLDKTNVSKELMYLDISKDDSKFYSRDVYVQDSIMTATFEKQIKTTGGMHVTSSFTMGGSGSIRYKIYKTYPKYEVSMETRIGSDVFKVSDDRPISWKILPEKEKIGNWESQKATTEFGGRKWTAWFSTDLPFQDGPYKFHGLPGLIVKMEDQAKSHIFELKGASKFVASSKKVSEYISDSSPIEISQKQYQKLYKENRDDPGKTLRMLISNGAQLQFVDQNGANISPTQQLKNIEERQKIVNKKDNNILELDLLQ